jgi:hypothetical protein
VGPGENSSAGSRRRPGEINAALRLRTARYYGDAGVLAVGLGDAVGEPGAVADPVGVAVGVAGADGLAVADVGTAVGDALAAGLDGVAGAVLA